MNKKYLAMIFLTVLVLGCTDSSGGFDKNAGAAIREFSIDITDLVENEDTGVIISVQNVGGKTMPGDSKLWFYGPTFDEDTSWSVTGDIATATESGYDIETNEFMPPDGDRGIEGEIVYMDGTMSYHGDIAEGLPPQTFTFNARVCYPYTTSAATALKSQSRDEYRANPVKGTKAQTIESAGPIQINLKGNENIRLSNSRMQLQFDIANVGIGNPLQKNISHCFVGPNIKIAQLNKINFTVTVDGQDTDCVDKIVSIDRTTNKATAYCKAEISETDSDDPNHEFYITATAEYDYYITETLKVQVADGNGDQ
ncbi:hypothetical protein GQ473_06010 [archaeon]|nr:hypothetical protein [archaeon]